MRNAAKAQHDDVTIPSSKLKRELARILKEQGYIEGFEVEPPGAGHPGEPITVTLKYTDKRKPVITRPPARVAPRPAHVRRPRPHPEDPGRHGHRDHLDVPRRHDRPRGPHAGVGGEVVAKVW